MAPPGVRAFDAFGADPADEKKPTGGRSAQWARPHEGRAGTQARYP